MESIWTRGYDLTHKTKLKNNKVVENVVIGGGMTGILTAYFLHKRGQEVIVLEQKSVGGGQTGGTTAKITSQHDLFYHKLIKNCGLAKAALYAKANEEALSWYEKVIKEEKIDCRFEKRTAYLYTRNRDGIKALEKEEAAAKRLGIKAMYTEGNCLRELPFPTRANLRFENQAQFHPMEFLRHLASILEEQGVEIYESTKVLEVEKHKVITNRGTVWAENIIFATHYPFINVPGFYFLRQHQERSYVLALRGEKELSGMYYGIDKGGLSLRSAGDILLLAGGGHRTGKHRDSETEGYNYLRQKAQIYYKNSREADAWSAQDCVSHDKIPFIGKYSIFRPYWYVATAFKKWGMTSAMISARMISNLIVEGEDEYQRVFKPNRFCLRASAIPLMVDIGESFLGLSKGLFSSSKRKCRHLGCRLEWNAEEKSWDCPCHGSRYNQSGTVQDNPAQTDLKG